LAHGAKSCHSVSPQVHRFSRSVGPDYVWQVQPISHTLNFVAKLLEIREKYADIAWRQMDMDSRVEACGDLDLAVMERPPEEKMDLSYDFAGEAWSELVDWMDKEKMIESRTKSSRRIAAAAVCHNMVGDKRVAMWIIRFGTHKRALEVFEQRRIEAFEKSQGFGSSSESQPAAQARRTRFALRLADVTRLKMSMADCPDAWCSCGHYGRQFERAHCQAQYCQANCQVVIKEDDNPTKKGRYLVCKRCHRDDGKPLELMVTAKLPPHSRTLRCEAHISFARKCINRLVHECRFCNRWLCEYCSGHRPVCVCVCVMPCEDQASRCPVESPWPWRVVIFAGHDAAVLAERSDTGGRLLGDGQGFQDAGRTGRGTVYTADARLVLDD